MFVVDGSGSIENPQKGNFQRAKDFIIEIVKSFNIGKEATQVALVLYNNEPEVVFKFKYKFDEIEEEIQDMKHQAEVLTQAKHWTKYAMMSLKN